ncbi:hypothetical protein DM806_26270 [Sphingobium lactosutens]|uniref:hypothetical protein n=1 Tax=Sphingobium lactosutens TaxID=522773 RepID=UPI0015BC62FB|nr:hypothetical protein [Sphingobium lactosutens]NWK99099.1 hypothetical protein [Sphingobium lactosutens]
MGLAQRVNERTELIRSIRLNQQATNHHQRGPVLGVAKETLPDFRLKELCSLLDLFFGALPAQGGDMIRSVVRPLLDFASLD